MIKISGVQYFLFFISTFLQWPLAHLSENAPADSANVELAFPEAWNGDAYKNVTCRTNEIPDWLDGYFLALVNAAYGRSSDSLGSKLTHMFDGLAAVASVQFKDSMVRFSGKYFPTKAYKIWDFYGRDMRQSRVAWSTLRSPHTAKAKETWDRITSEYASFNPNMDIWKIGNRVIAVADDPRIGLQFDVPSLSDFHVPQFHETHELFRGLSSVKFLSATVHSNAENFDLYSTASGLEPSTSRVYQFVFKINSQGIRTLEGAFEFGRYDPSKCGPDKKYFGDKRILAGLVSSVGNTEKYLIIPVSSAVLNPCAYQTSNSWNDTANHSLDAGISIEFDQDVPVRFLVFNKLKRHFVTSQPLESYPPRFMSNHLNAYEDGENRVIIDTIAYDNYDSYDRSLFIDYLMQASNDRQHARPVRFALNLKTNFVERTHLSPETNQIPMEFPVINPKYIGKRYRYAYVVRAPFGIGNQLGKIDTTDHSGTKNFYFSHGSSVVLGQPVFVPRPDSTAEDDGVVLSVGLETLRRRSVLYIIDAKSMKEVGRAEMPVVVPFGFHCRYFDRRELEPPQSLNTDGGPTFGSNDPMANKDPLTTWNPGDPNPSWTPTDPNPSSTPTDPNPTLPPKSDPNPTLPPIEETTESPNSTIDFDSDSNEQPLNSMELNQTKMDNRSSPLENWLNSGTEEKIEPLETLNAPKIVKIAQTNFTGTKGYYLSNGTFVEVFPDGSIRLFPPIPNFANLMITTKPTSKKIPPYVDLVIEPVPEKYLQHSFVTSSIRNSPTIVAADNRKSHQRPHRISSNRAAPVRVKSKATNSTIRTTFYPQHVFPGFYGTRAMTTVAPTSRSYQKMKRPLVRLAVDSNERQKRSQADHVGADSGQGSAINTTSPTDGIETNVVVDRLWTRGKKFLCDLLANVIAAFHSGFCKEE